MRSRSIPLRPSRWALASAVAFFVLARPALAHRGAAGLIPATPWQGLLAGLGHPILGLDHLGFVVGVGIWSALCGLRWSAPILFVLGTLLGCVLELASFSLPLCDALVALTLVIAGGALLLVDRAQARTLSLLLSVAGVLHGLAYGETIVGAQPGPVGAYLIGFTAMQLALAQSAYQLYRACARVPERAERVGQIWATGACALGALLLVLQIAG